MAPHDALPYNDDYWRERFKDDPKAHRDPLDKFYLVFSLLCFFKLTIFDFLSELFSSEHDRVKMRVGHFLGAPSGVPTEDNLAAYPPAVIFDLWRSRSSRSSRPFVLAIVRRYALEIALKESDNIIQDRTLKIKIKDLTTEGIRRLLRPEVLKSRLHEQAPFIWSILHLFCSAPNDYRKNMARRARRRDTRAASVSSDVEMSESGCSHTSGVSAAPDDLEFAQLGQSLDDEDDSSGEDDWEDDPLTDMDSRDPDGSSRDDFKGFARSPVLAVLVSLSVLAFTRNKATNLLPLLLGIFFKISGTSTRVILALSNMGLSVSGKQVERLKERISDDSIHHATELMTADDRSWYFLYDNINIYLRKFQQRLTNRNEMIHATNSAIVGLSPPIEVARVTDLKAKLDLRGRRSAASWQDVAPTLDDDARMEQAFEYHIMDIIVRYCPGAARWKGRADLASQVSAAMPKDRPLPAEKTDARPFGVFDVNEGSKKGIIDLLKAAQERSTLSEAEWSGKTKILVGDWLSSNNTRLARRDRADDVDSMERLDYTEEVSALWHFALQATHMLMRAHYGRAGLDPTSLASHKGLLRRTWDVNKPNYAASKSLIRHSLIARILHIVMVLCNLTSWEDLQKWRPQSFEDLRQLAARIRAAFANVNEAESAKRDGDDWYAHDIYFIRDSLFFLEFESAVAWADAGRVLRVMRYWLMMFRGAGQHNYARECAEILLRWKFEMTDDIRRALEKAWFINRSGLDGRWIASDLWLEQCNYYVKRVFIAQGNGVTIEYIMKKGSACVEAFREISHLTARFFGDSDRARLSKEVSFFEDVRALVIDMCTHDLHNKMTSAPRFVPAQKKGNQKTPPSSVFDVMAAGAEVWQNGKFKEYIAATTYDPQVGYARVSTTSDKQDGRLDTGTVFDNIENPISCDGFEDVHGDEFGEVSGAALGGGGEYTTGEGFE
ncbi:hypothetical protein GGG16DRAFT_105392 [Schizophyllum commune]